MDSEMYMLTLTYDELLIIHNSLNEICHGLPQEDFENRIGRPLVEVEELFERIKELENKPLSKKH